MLGPRGDGRRGTEVACRRERQPPVSERCEGSADVPVGRGVVADHVVRRAVVDGDDDVDVRASGLAKEAVDLGGEVGVPAPDDRDDGHGGGHVLSPASTTQGRPDARASRRSAASRAPCPELQRDQPLASASVRRIQHVVPPLRRWPGRVPAGDTHPAQGHGGRRLLAVGAMLGDDDGWSPGCRDVRDRVLPGMGDHHVRRTQLCPEVRRRPLRASLGPGPSRGCLACGPDGRRVGVTPAGAPEQEHPAVPAPRNRLRSGPPVEA